MRDWRGSAHSRSGKRSSPRVCCYHRRQLSPLDALDVDLWDSKGTADAHGEAWVSIAGPPGSYATDTCAMREFGGRNELLFDLISAQAPEFCEFFEMLGERVGLHVGKS